MSRRRVLLLAILVAVPLIAYGAGSAVVWDKLTAVPTQCGGRWTENTPQAFEAPEEYELDTTPWLMPAPEEVRIPSRDPGIELAGWWIPAESAEAGAPAPTVIVVHGFTACRHDHAVLLPAGMLHGRVLGPAHRPARSRRLHARGRALRRRHGRIPRRPRRLGLGT